MDSVKYAECAALRAGMIESTHRHLRHLGAAAYQLGNTSSRTITEVKQR